LELYYKKIYFIQIGTIMKENIAVIIGAGPAGLTAAYELLEKTNIKPIIFEKTSDIGGISKTVNYKGNRIDIGGHRFFSKSDRVMNFWKTILPLQGKPSLDDIILGRNMNLSENENAQDPENEDNVMLIRNRLSRIFFLRKFFNYPITLNFNTLKNLGFIRIIKIGYSYFISQIFKIKYEKNLEDFFINRFGKELYKTFFEDYTYKVWGKQCDEINPEWGAQRIKGLSITKAIIHSFKNLFSNNKSISQKNTETSLIEQFMYPKYGPGQLWEELSEIIKKKGGEIYLNHEIVKISYSNCKIQEVTIKDCNTEQEKKQNGNYVFSTMPVDELIHSISPKVPNEIVKIADGLMYRNFITVGLLLNKLKIQNKTKIKTINNNIPDNWIYIQERDVKVGRLQIFNNWSPYMVKDLDTIWIGLEYFCDENDDLWNKPDNKLVELAINELMKIDIIEKGEVLDSTVIKMPKTYPAYFGTYNQFGVLQNFVDKFDNLFLIGRNGMHRYNNQDHSMLTAMVAVDNIVNGIKSKKNIWEVNVEKSYHENKN